MEVTVTSSPPVASEIEQLRARLAELEQTAARRARELTALHEISLEIGRLTDLTTLLQAIVEKAAGLLNAHMGGLYLVHPESQTLELVVAHNLPGILTGTILNMGEGSVRAHRANRASVDGARLSGVGGSGRRVRGRRHFDESWACRSKLARRSSG